MLQQQQWLESEIASKTEVTDEEAKKFYEANKAEFEQPETVKASHILFRVNKEDSEEVVNKKLEQAKTAEARAKKGEDFDGSRRNFPKSRARRNRGAIWDFFRKIAWSLSLPSVAFSQKSAILATRCAPAWLARHQSDGQEGRRHSAL